MTKLFWEIVQFQPVPSFGVVWSGPRQQQRVLLAMWGRIGWGLPLPFKMIGKTYMLHVSAQRPRSNLSKCFSWSFGYKQEIWVSKIYWVTPFTNIVWVRIFIAAVVLPLWSFLQGLRVTIAPAARRFWRTERDTWQKLNLRDGLSWNSPSVFKSPKYVSLDLRWFIFISGFLVSSGSNSNKIFFFGPMTQWPNSDLIPTKPTCDAFQDQAMLREVVKAIGARFRKGVSTEDSVLMGHDTTLTYRQLYNIILYYISI